MLKSAVLRVKNLHKEYRHGRPRCLGFKRGSGGDRAKDGVKVAVVDSSFAVDAGEIFGLLGPNGAGKSTTLNAVIAETRPTSGEVGIGCFCRLINNNSSNNNNKYASCPDWRISPHAVRRYRK